MPPAERTRISRGRFGRFAERSRCQRLFDRLDDRRRLGHAARAEFSTGHWPRFGADEQYAVVFQAIEVAAGRRVQPHPHVHRRGGEHAFVGRQQESGGQIVGEPGRHSGENVRARRRDHDQVGGARQLDMADRGFVREAEQFVADRLPAKGRRRKRGNELLSRRGHDDAHRRAAVSQPPDQLQRLVGRYSSTDDQENTSARQRDGGHWRSPVG